MKLVPFSLVSALALATACGVAPRENDTSAADANESEMVAPVVLNIGIDQLHVARFDLDLDVNIARFTEPAATLPLDRVIIFGEAPEEVPEPLDGVVTRCYELFGYDVTGGGAFIVGQGEDIVTSLSGSGSNCAECGAVVICAGSCPNLGPGEVPRGDPSTYDTDPPEGDTGVDNGGGDDGGEGGSDGSSGGSGGSDSGSGGTASGSGSTSGGSTGGSGGSSGGVGQPGGD